MLTKEEKIAHVEQEIKKLYETIYNAEILSKVHPDQKEQYDEYSNNMIIQLNVFEAELNSLNNS